MKDFIEVIGITGAFALGLEGIIILLLCLKTRKKCPKKAAYQYKLPTFVKVLFILLLLLV